MGKGSIKAKAGRNAANPRAWQRMLSGRRLDLLEPSPIDIEIEDIAHGLARVARWNGQTKGDCAFSVAQHCVLVERLFCKFFPGIESRWKLACLLHDGPEYVIGDMISPFKATLAGDYRSVEERLCVAIHIRFGLPGRLPEKVQHAIKRADRVAAFLEATQLAGFSERDARRFIARPRQVPTFRIKPQHSLDAAETFLRRFRQLDAQCRSRGGGGMASSKGGGGTRT